jgi:predicted lipoprotein with Yx(FWY)xxD motif
VSDDMRDAFEHLAEAMERGAEVLGERFEWAWLFTHDEDLRGWDAAMNDCFPNWPE